MGRDFWNEAEQAAKSAGSGLLDLGMGAIEGLAANWSPTYANRIMLQQKLEDDTKRQGLQRDYMKELIGGKAQSNFPQAVNQQEMEGLPPEMQSMFGQQASGYLGGQQSPADQLRLMSQMTSAPIASSRAGGVGMIRDLMQAKTAQRMQGPAKPFKPSMFTTGVKGDPKGRQQSYFDQQGNLQTAGPSWQTGAQTVVNNNVGGGFKPEAGYMKSEDGAGVVPIPGGSKDVTGTANVQKETKAYNAENAMYKPLYDNMDRFVRLIERHGTEVIPGEAKRTMQAVRTSLMLQMKEYYELGAITGPDMELMNSLIPDPNTLASGVMPNEAMIAGMNEVKRMIQQTQGSLKGKYPNADIKEAKLKPVSEMTLEEIEAELAGMD